MTIVLRRRDSVPDVPVLPGLRSKGRSRQARSHQRRNRQSGRHHDWSSHRG